MTNVTDRVFEIVRDNLDVVPHEVHIGAEFFDDLGCDSLDFVELIMAFETDFDIEIPDDDGEKFETLGDAIAYIQDAINVKSN